MTRCQIAVIVETSSGYGRGVLEGIGQYVRTHDNWSVFFQQWDLFGEVPSWLEQWKGDGIISRIASPHLLSAVQATEVPFVNLTDRHQASIPSHIRSDDIAIGREAAKHLRERGFRRFGYCGFSGELWSDRRREGFLEAIEGDPCGVYESPWTGSQSNQWEIEQSQIQSWLSSLKGPFAVMACNDVRARQVLDACMSIGISVPEHAAVIGVDNDELLCQFCVPPLSSVIPNSAAVGYQAADILASMIRGEQPDETRVIPPIGIAIRQSTDIVAIEDDEIAKALRFIREHACQGVSVADVLKRLAISRGVLERQLRKYIGRTPQQEIRRVQIAKVCELLAKSDLSVEKIAVHCGFENPEYMYVVFKRLMQMTPSEYRRTARVI